jgi:hypothetical protein
MLMSGLLYIIGLIIGVAVFIYLYVTYQTSRDKYRARSGRGTRPAASVNPDFVDYFSIKRPPGTRLCPLCGKELTRYEALYASQIEEKGKKMILIHGCRYCYKEDTA